MGRNALGFCAHCSARILERKYAYFAGFLDGEGCFDITNGTSPRVSVTNTYPKVLHDLQAWFGGTVRELARTDKHRPCYQWTVNGENARRFCEKVLPYLQEKRPQASILLRFGNYPRHSTLRHTLLVLLKALKRIVYETTDTTH